jgi:hypothetical protein
MSNPIALAWGIIQARVMGFSLKLTYLYYDINDWGNNRAKAQLFYFLYPALKGLGYS